MYTELYEMNLRQLERLLDTKRVNFRDAYYIIFSDYPTKTSVANILGDSAIKANKSIIERLEKEFDKL